MSWNLLMYTEILTAMTEPQKKRWNNLMKRMSERELVTIVTEKSGFFFVKLYSGSVEVNSTTLVKRSEGKLENSDLNKLLGDLEEYFKRTKVSLICY